MSDSSERTSRENGCVHTDCIVALPCGRIVVPKDKKTFCVRMITETKRNAVEKRNTS